MIFVTVGTERFPFDRLVRAIDEAAEQLNGEPIVVQLGCGTYLPKRCKWARFLAYQELVEQLAKARIVVSHAGVGSLLLCAQLGKVPIVVPRLRCFEEHVDDHQLEWARRMASLGHVLLAECPEELLSLLAKDGHRQTLCPPQRHGEPALAQLVSSYLRTIP